jgi:lipopolysaccharide export system ATP-binding protein
MLTLKPAAARLHPETYGLEEWTVKGRRLSNCASCQRKRASVTTDVEPLLQVPDANDSRPQPQGLSVISITKAYGKRLVLRGISLDVRSGEVVGLLGPNGAGKTVCFYSIVGLTKPDSGRILLNGVDISQLPTYRRAILGLSYLPQESSIFRGLTVAQNIEAILEIVEPDSAAVARRLDQLLNEFHIAHLRDSLATTLSGGERRRCEIARALASTPSIILLDEPFAGIDPITVFDIKQLVRDLKKRDIGVLITDHNVHEMLELVDRAYIIYDGRVLFQGTPTAMIADANVRRLYLGEDFKF